MFIFLNLNMTISYDFIITVTGAGEGSLLYELKESGQRILVLKKNRILPDEKENWDSSSVFNEGEYHNFLAKKN
jgi:hypothetical protein